MMKFIVEEEIFKAFPDLKLVVTNAVIDDPNVHLNDIEEYLKEAWKYGNEAASEYGNPQSHPFIKVWGESMKNVGVNRNKFPSSIEALVRRAGKNSEPVNINAFVDFYNATSLLNLVPVGGFDLDRIKNDIELRFSKVGDTFKALDTDEILELKDGDVVYADNSNIITRHFVWKQSTHAIMNPDTKRIFFVSEVLGGLPEGSSQTVAKAFKNGIEKYFDTKCDVVIMDETTPVYEF